MHSRGDHEGDSSGLARRQAALDDPSSHFTLSVDGEGPIDILTGCQTPFEAETQSGPAWSWDHDGDGPGDGDGDGLGDWSGPVVFFRYVHPGMTSGMHTFDFALQFEGVQWEDHILVEEVE